MEIWASKFSTQEFKSEDPKFGVNPDFTNFKHA